MHQPDQQSDANERSDKTETRLSRWECVVIKCFAILFLILFLSEKAIKEAGSIRRTWAIEIKARLETVPRKESGCCCAVPAASVAVPPKPARKRMSDPRAVIPSN